MVSEITINRLENVLTEVIDFSGTKEQTTIISNMEVVNAAPTGLTGFVTIKDNRDGDTILASTLPGIVYTTGDLVNVLFIDGTEPIAFQQASGSATANGLWELEGGTGPDIFYDDGNVGIGTATIPHGGIGAALLALDGVDSVAATGPNIQITTDSDDHPIIQVLAFSHDSCAISYDAYFDGSWKSSDVGSNFQIIKSGDLIRFRTETGIAQGGAITWVDEMSFDPVNNRIGFGTAAATARFQLGGSSTVFRITDNLVANSDWDILPQTGNVTVLFRIRDVSAAADRFDIDSSGNVGIGGVTAPAAKLHVDQASTTAAESVLRMDQADVSEPFIDLIGTAAAATLTQSLVDEGDVTTATRIGWYKINVDDVGNQITDGDYFVPFYSLA